MTSKKKPALLSRSVLIALGIPTVFIPGLILASLLGWNWQHDLQKLQKQGGYTVSREIFPEKAVVAQVYDGDTIVLATGQTLRLIGINAPDRGEAGYEESKAYLENMIDGEEVSLEYDTYQDDKFGRVLAYVWEQCSKSWGCKDGKRLVNAVLLHEHKAKLTIYEDRKKLKYEDLLRSGN